MCVFTLFDAIFALPLFKPPATLRSASSMDAEIRGDGFDAGDPERKTASMSARKSGRGLLF